MNFRNKSVLVLFIALLSLVLLQGCLRTRAQIKNGPEDYEEESVHRVAPVEKIEPKGNYAIELRYQVNGKTYLQRTSFLRK